MSDRWIDSADADDYFEEMQERQDGWDEASHADYIREAYGDPCPICGCLRWQADCPNFDEVEGHRSKNDIQADRHVQLSLPLEFFTDWADDIPF